MAVGWVDREPTSREVGIMCGDKEQLGQRAYTAWGAALGLTQRPWEGLRELERAAWTTAAVRTASLAMHLADARAAGCYLE